jgi:hypothetical protein
MVRVVPDVIVAGAYITAGVAYTALVYWKYRKRLIEHNGRGEIGDALIHILLYWVVATAYTWSCTMTA